MNTILVQMREQRLKKWILAAGVLVALIIGIVICTSGAVSASTKESGSLRKWEKVGYVSIHVQDGDTLWSIAEEYYDSCHKSSAGTDCAPDNDEIRSFIREIKKINQLAGNRIYSGKPLVLPVYR